MIFLVISALIISALAPESLANDGFWASLFYTITMVMDAGCIQFVVEDVGTAGVAVILVCLATIFLGMVIFTGAMIGFITNWISSIIDKANKGMHSLKISDHTVILNWNTRASEIVNDLLYSPDKERIVILVPDRKEAIEKEIADRIADTLAKEKEELKKRTIGMSGIEKIRYVSKYGISKNKLTVIVREGETYLTQQLNDICIKAAKAVIILGKDVANNVCKYDFIKTAENLSKGNSETIKTLVQVSDLTSADDSADDQKIIVEVEDDWTLGIVRTIISHKERSGKCNIVPVSVNRILGQILSQFSIMPELNLVYSELFSNKGAAFYDEGIVDSESLSFVKYKNYVNKRKVINADGTESEEFYENENCYQPTYMKNHKHAIPLDFLNTKKNGCHCYYVADSHHEINNVSDIQPIDMQVEIVPDFNLEKRNVIILGHNSKNEDIMRGFNSFCNEWHLAGEDATSILDITVIDEALSLEKLDFYSKYNYVTNCVAADVYDQKLITEVINNFIDTHEGDVSVLILSDDMVKTEDLDSKALTYLVYVQDIVHSRKNKNPDFDTESIDIIVELLNPKNSDVVKNYSVENVVISNRYISKMMTQIAEKESLFDFYNDILSYDDSDVATYESKELYIKKAKRYFVNGKIPGECTATELIRAVFDGSKEAAKHAKREVNKTNEAVLLGYVRKGRFENPDEKMVIFTGNQDKIKVNLRDDDKLIIFSNH
ncbi:MAG: hypothetical protein J6Q94_05940 [Clostridia bacterium]|nr:hypothetical protein [Clostridia bacterium]